MWNIPSALSASMSDPDPAHWTELAQYPWHLQHLNQEVFEVIGTYGGDQSFWVMTSLREPAFQFRIERGTNPRLEGFFQDLDKAFGPSVQHLYQTLWKELRKMVADQDPEHCYYWAVSSDVCETLNASFEVPKTLRDPVKTLCPPQWYGRIELALVVEPPASRHERLALFEE